MKYKLMFVLLISSIVFSGCVDNPDAPSALPFEQKEYKIYSISTETQQGSLFTDAKTYYVVFYIDTDNSIKRISGSSDDTKNLLIYKLSEGNYSKLIKTKNGYYYDEWDLYLPKN